MSLMLHNISFTAGSRKLASVPRHLHTVSFGLEEALTKQIPHIPESAGDCDGYRILSAPVDLAGRIVSQLPDHIRGGQERYHRNYIDMSGDFASYLAGFSGKTRSTLRRKQRKFEQEDGGELDVCEFRSGVEVGQFLEEAIPLSRKTYQARLLDAGLPETTEARERFIRQADDDLLRCYLLRLGGDAVAYLTLPIVNDTVIYAFLGYDPATSRLSPGTVLQIAALERLFAENRFRYFDFTEGEGAHKAMFGTHSVECCSFLLLKPNVANRLLLGSLAAFDSSIAAAKSLAERTGALATARKLLRS